MVFLSRMTHDQCSNTCPVPAVKLMMTRNTQLHTPEALLCIYFSPSLPLYPNSLSLPPIPPPPLSSVNSMSALSQVREGGQ